MNNDPLGADDKNDLKRLKMLESVFDNAQVGIIVSEHDKKKAYINSEFTRIFGYDVDDVTSKDFMKSFLSQEDYEKHEELIQRV
jgi:PAS domain S-box-containing protein